MSTLRLPGSISAGASGNSALDLLDYEIAGEKASALGRAGAKVEKTLALLAAHEGDATGRRLVLQAAADAVYAYFIQRELCGFRRHVDIIREYRIPGEVLSRLGAK